jgi:nicotinic acid mononucleotide adenylyltransferase
MIASNPYLLSRIWIGGSRSGKSYLVALTLRELKKRYQSRLRAWLISGADRESEAHYWEPCDRLDKCDLASASTYVMAAAFERWQKIVDEFTALPCDPENPKLLIVDEASLIASTGELLESEVAIAFWKSILLKAVHLSSAGAATGMAIWLITPNGVMDALKMNRHHVGAFNPVFVGHIDYWNTTVFRSAATNGLTPDKPPTKGDIMAAKSIGCDRVVGINNKWYPVANVEMERTAQPDPFVDAAQNIDFWADDSELTEDETIEQKFLGWLTGKGAATFKEAKGFRVRPTKGADPAALPADKLRSLIEGLEKQGAIAITNGKIAVKA